MSRQIDHKEFIRRLDERFPNRNYKVVSNYVKTSIPILVSDKHGEYLIKPTSLIIGETPSIKCAVDKNKTVKSKFEEVHGELYDYSKFEYVTAKNKGKVTCKTHGDFLITPNDHLSGKGCRECGFISRSIGRRTSTDEFINRARKVHGNKYDYNSTDYLSAKVPITIICPVHGGFSQIPNYHLSGNGCQKCGLETGGFSKTDFVKNCKSGLAILYVIRCYLDEESFYKVGITSRTIKDRYRKHELPYQYEIIHNLELPAGKVWELERELLRKFSSFKYKPKIDFEGKTECLTIDPINYKN